MAPFSVLSGCTVSAQCCCLNKPAVFCEAGKIRIRTENFSFLGRKRKDQSVSFVLSPCISHDRRCKLPHGLCRSRMIVSKIGGTEERHARIGIGRKPNPGNRKLFSLRLRPRLRLFMLRLKRASIQAASAQVRLYIYRNLRIIILATSVSMALGLCVLFLKVTAVPQAKIVPYSDLITDLRDGYVSKVLFEEGSRRIFFNKHAAKPDGLGSDVTSSKVDIEYDGIRGSSESSRSVGTAGGVTGRSLVQWQYSTRKIDHDESFLLTLMREKGTTYISAPQSVLMSLRNLVITVLTLWIPLTPLMWLLYRQLSSANSPAKKRKPTSQIVSFEDVEGVDAAKAELMEIVSCLQGSTDYNKLGAKLPRGVLLVGPPGTGKTLLARAVAGEAGVPFFSVSASEFVELFVGRGAARIRDLFKVARKYAPALIFIDELDAVGGKRGKSFNDERDQTLNQLLTEMDGFETATKVIVIAATNRPEALDPALCRPGRFSRKVLVGEPDFDGRKRILHVHLRGIPLEEDPQLMCNLIASLTPGLVGADLANIVNEAALLAARRGGETVTREDIMVAVERAKFGISDQRLTPSNIGMGLEKLFPWVPSLIKREKDDGFQGFLGYQTLS